MFKKSKILTTMFADCDCAFDYFFTAFFWAAFLFGDVILGIGLVLVAWKLLA